jgi:hypothetical protein
MDFLGVAMDSMEPVLEPLLPPRRLFKPWFLRWLTAGSYGLALRYMRKKLREQWRAPATPKAA